MMHEVRFVRLYGDNEELNERGRRSFSSLVLGKYVNVL